MTDPRVEIVRQALGGHLGIAAPPAGQCCAEVVVAALDAYDAPKFSSVVHECCERPTEADLRERIAREIEAMADEYRTHDEIDSMQGEVKDQLHAAVRIARGTDPGKDTR